MVLIPFCPFLTLHKKSIIQHVRNHLLHVFSNQKEKYIYTPLIFVLRNK